jgi:hypothetical protein
LYHRRTNEERQEAEGFVELGDGIMYSTMMALVAPTAPVRGTKPVMSSLPREVLNPREWADPSMEEGRYNTASDILPMVPDRMVDEATVSIGIVMIKRGMQSLIKKVRCGKAFEGKKH